MLKIGIDVGGTFTDLVAVDDTGRSTLAKVASTPEDPSIGVMAGLDRLADILQLPRSRTAGARPSASCTAPPSPPMLCSSTREPRSGC